MGGQTALNCVLDLESHGVLEKYGVEMIGATSAAIRKAEDRQLFREAMERIGLACPYAEQACNVQQAQAIQDRIGFPTIIRPSFTLGGTGSGIAYDIDDFNELCEQGLRLSPVGSVLIEESVIGWKEFELEVVRDKHDNCIIVCSIENVDPMGVHTGDSITVAPALTLSDKEYQVLRNAAIAVLREIGIDTGGSNVQFAINPQDGRCLVIEMNPRVSRSSALASKATGFPIARVAAKLAVGLTLDELNNEVTSVVMTAAFEPTIDYVVTKIPLFNFEKFRQTDTILNTQMKSVGEAMAIGRTFQESLQKALRSLEENLTGLDEIAEITDLSETSKAKLMEKVRQPSPDRLRYVADALRAGVSVDEINVQSGIDHWFLYQIDDLVQEELQLQTSTFEELHRDTLWCLKRKGFSDARLAGLLGTSEGALRAQRIAWQIKPVYKRVDSCAAEFSTRTSYLYSTYETECEAAATTNKKIIVLGSGPNRIGQGIEFDYCCVQAALAIRKEGFESIMVNCNPETVSTDFDISDRLYFEPLTIEDVLSICDLEQPFGVIIQYGGQTPLKLCSALAEAKVPIIGTLPDSIDKAEDRQRFEQLIEQLGLRQPPHCIATNVDDALRLSQSMRYPLLVRPSYVLGGRAMVIVHNAAQLRHHLKETITVSGNAPILIDTFLEDAIEVDVDAVCDGQQALIGGVMEHIELAGVHSGDSACSLPPCSLSKTINETLRSQTKQLALALEVRGVINVQYAIRNEGGEDIVYVLEANPRASRTIPFVSKATGMPLVSLGVQCMIGHQLADLGYPEPPSPLYFFVKESVFPFFRFKGVHPLLGPEMHSTGEVMGIGDTFAKAYYKALAAADNAPPLSGAVLISVCDADKENCIPIADTLAQRGYRIVATTGTAQVLRQYGIGCTLLDETYQKRAHNTTNMLQNGQIQVIINTTGSNQAIADADIIWRTALQYRVPYFTTLEGARAMLKTLTVSDRYAVNAIQTLHRQVNQ